MKKLGQKYQYQEKALNLIKCNEETQSYEFTQEGKDLIQSVQGSIGVISVAGLYRTGKSYLLNRMLLNRSSGFGIGPTVNACTKGLWIWGQPILGQLKSGESINVFIIDSEGIGSVDVNQDHDNKIFALTILLSSTFIYNSIGAIDESAIQNLSLIVNLTQNIHIKSQQNDKDIDEDEYSAFFPQFIWTVRDFSLQLTDSQGGSIDSNQYLENQLQLQKGNAKDVEQKNRVRKSLATYFKDRNCFCMFRPTNNEQDLQNLDKLEFEKLRPEFIEQVIQLRKKVLTSVKPKQLNGQNLTGDMYCELISSYVQAINQGACPNIEDAWLTICNTECGKAKRQAIDLYERQMNEVCQKLPVESKELIEIHKTSKQQAIKFFKKKALGNLQQDFIQNFEEEIKKIFKNIKNQNEQELYNQCQGYINQSFIKIERSLRNGEYKTFFDFEQDCAKFMEYYMKNGPNSNKKKEIILEFLSKQLKDATQLFLRDYQEQSNMNKIIKEDTIQKMQKMKDDLDKEIDQEKQKFQSMKQQLELEKKEIDSKLQISQNQLIAVQQETAQQSYQQVNEFMNQKQNLNTQLLELKTKMQDQESEYKIQIEQFYMEKTEFEKERLLLTQKIQYLDHNMEELQEKDKKNNNNLKNQKQEINEQLKEVNSKYEKQLRDLQQQLKEQNEYNIDLESIVSQTKQQLEIIQKKATFNSNQSNNTIQQLQKEIQQISQENKDWKLNNENLQEQLNKLQQQNKENLNQNIIELENMIKNKDEQLRQLNNQIEKDKAVFQQKNQFLELQVNELNQQVSEHKKQSENLISTFELKQNNNTDQEKQKLVQLQEKHQVDINNLQNEMENQQKRLYQQIKQLQEKIGEIELQDKLVQNDQIQQINKLKEALENSENYRQTLFEKNEFLEKNIKKVTKECEERYNVKIQDAEQQIEQLLNQHSVQNLQIQEQSEDNINQLKQYYLSERERLEKKYQDEKKKQERQIEQIIDEHDHKLKEQVEYYEDMIENYIEQLKEQEQDAQSIINQYEQEIALKDQQIKNQEINKEDLKQSIQDLQNKHQQSLESLINNYNQDKNKLQQKIEQIVESCLNKDKDIAILQQKCDSLWDQISKTEYQSQNKEKEYISEKESLKSKINELDNQNKILNEDLLEKKIILSRDIALKNQENEFAQKKIYDLQNQLQNQNDQIDEKIQQQKLDLLNDFKEKQLKLQESKDYLEQKVEKQKKTIKDLESSTLQEIQRLSHENISLNEYIKNFQSKTEFQSNQSKQENESLQYQIQQYKINLDKKEKEYQTENTNLKEQNTQYKQQLDEQLSIYDKDKALWDHKYQFLDQQRIQYKQELSEQRKKFEQTLTLIRKQKSEIDLEKTNQHAQEMIQNLEKKYQQEIYELQEESNKNKYLYEEKIQKLEKALKDINEDNIIENQKRIGNNNYNQNKLYELLDNEKKLHHEIDQLKQERDNKNIDFQKVIDIEREKFNQKILTYENKIRDTEYKKQQQFFEHEKQRASWQQERDFLMSQKEEIQDQLEYIGRKRDTLLKENEKIKNDQRNNRKTVTGVYQPNGLNSRYKQSPISTNKQMKNSINTELSDMFDNRNQNASPMNLSYVSNDIKKSPIKKN